MTDTPTWKDLLPTITSAMPHNSDPDGSVARNIAYAVEMNLEWRAKPRTVQQRVALALLEHLNVADDRPGGTITCSCGRWNGRPGDRHTVHVAEKLHEAGLLVDDE